MARIVKGALYETGKFLISRTDPSTSRQQYRGIFVRGRTQARSGKGGGSDFETVGITNL